MFTRKHYHLFTIGFMLLAQNLLSQILLGGVVTDNGAEYLGNGAEPVINALVTLTDQADAQRTFSAYTDDQGEYSIEITTGISDSYSHNPGNFMLHQNYPNPFNPSTTIKYGLPRPAFVSLSIYDVNGRRIITLVDEKQEKGWHQVQWHAVNSSGQRVSSGVYLVKLKAGQFVDTKKIMLMK